jgi:hypothetical protein
LENTFPERVVNITKIKVILMDRESTTNPAFAMPYGSSGGASSYGYDWYFMKLKEEKEAKELTNG